MKHGVFDIDRRPYSDSRHVTAPYKSALYYYFFTLGIKDPVGFGKKLEKKIIGVTITPGSTQTQRNRVAARR